MGFHKGASWGPYINDLPEISKIAKFILYADDANIIITGSNIHEIHEKLATLAQGLLRWVDSNGLALNLRKTNYIVWSKQKIRMDHDIVIAGTKIERKSEARFLGVIVDEKLTWSRHIATVKSKMSRYIGIMYKIKSLLPLKARLQIFHSFVQSHLNYCSLVWGFSAKSNIESLFTKQKIAMRAIMPGYVNHRYVDGTLPSHTKSNFTEHNILTVHGIIVKNALTFMHKSDHFPNSLPLSIRSIIPTNAPTPESDHENAADWLAVYGEANYRSSIFFKGPLLAISSQNSDALTPACFISLKVYKNAVKHMLLDLQDRGDTDAWPNFLLYTVAGLRKSNRLNN